MAAGSVTVTRYSSALLKPFRSAGAPKRPNHLPNQTLGHSVWNAKLGRLFCRHVISAEKNIPQGEQAGEIFVSSFLR
jgi:hypothetical protein